VPLNNCYLLKRDCVPHSATRQDCAAKIVRGACSSHVPRGRVSHGRVPNERAPHGRVPYRRVPHRRVLYRRIYISKSKKALEKPLDPLHYKRWSIYRDLSCKIRVFAGRRRVMYFLSLYSTLLVVV
jgi:hypothetical protein